ncbi:hypothetical protein L3X38_003517 [Prunus dulcis]|uniref:Uncharacterized protein n=1 Tax=Prunus dulcis TaxID=3755 RepID=A0AAD5F213_PRUDU|nr:hypothetical protein L3X38_003517 [Prunus dulcis]
MVAGGGVSDGEKFCQKLACSPRLPSGGLRQFQGMLYVDAQNGPANIESNLGIRCDESLARKRAETLGEMDREVKVGALHKVPMCLAPRKCVFLRHRRRRGCLGASRFDAGSARFIMV